MLALAGITALGIGPLAPPPIEPPLPPGVQRAAAHPERVSALTGLLPVDRRAFERTTSKLTNLTNQKGKTAAELSFDVSQVCVRLDLGKPLLAALHATCEPRIAARKLSEILPARCADSAARCARITRRLAAALDGVATSLTAYRGAITAHIAAGDCRNAVLGRTKEAEATAALAAALRTYADAVAAGEPAAVQATEARATDQQRRLIAASDGRPVPLIMDELRDACGLPRWVDSTTWTEAS